MFVTTFEFREDAQYGGEGWIPAKHPTFNVTSGFGIAHDCMEHFANDDESLAAEMRAFGAMLLIRGEGGYYYNLRNQRPDPVFHMGSDLGRFLTELNNDEHNEWNDFPKAPNTYKLGEEAEEMLEKCLAEGKRSFIAELDFDDSEDEDGNSSYSEILLNKWLNNMRNWIRIGYRKAVKRYNGCHPSELTWLFEEVTNELKKHNMGDFGEVLKVSISPKNLTFNIRQEYQYE